MMEFLMLIQPVTETLDNLFGCMLGLGLFGWVAAYIVHVVFRQGRLAPSVDEYAKLSSGRSGVGREKLWETWCVKSAAVGFIKGCRAVAIIGLVGYLICCVPSSAKEMFKNQIVYSAVTSDTSEHAVRTLDKLLDTIDAKLDEIQE